MKTELVISKGGNPYYRAISKATKKKKKPKTEYIIAKNGNIYRKSIKKKKVTIKKPRLEKAKFTQEMSFDEALSVCLANKTI